jgi:hypothetical protein
MNRNFHNNYFIHHRFNTIPDVKLKNVDKLKKVSFFSLNYYLNFKKNIFFLIEILKIIIYYFTVIIKKLNQFIK